MTPSGWGNHNPRPHHRPTKLTSQQRADIRRARDKGASIQDLAAKYGVSTSTIRNCC